MKEFGTATFLCGRSFTAEEIEQLQDTVRVFSRLSWRELLQTICEHLDWVTPAGRYKLDSCAKALTKLEARGVLKLPVKRAYRRSKQITVIQARTNPDGEVVGTVRDVAPVELEPVRSQDLIKLWNEYVYRYHALGYKRPFGAHQRYFIVGGSGRRLGCLLFASSAWALAVRDEWIGWTERDRAQRLNWVVTNTRFMIFPWVRVRNLASKALSLAAVRIREDWQQRYGYRPVLLETFVDAERYRGTCYQAANWIRLGLTAGRGRMDRHFRRLSTPKFIYVYPLVPDFRSYLRGREARREDEQAKPTGSTTGAESTKNRKKAGAPRVATTPGGPGIDEPRQGHDI